MLGLNVAVTARAQVHLSKLTTYERVGADNLTYSFGCSHVPNEGATTTDITYTLTFAGNAAAQNGADAQDGRVITISGPTSATPGTSATVSDTGGTPAARLDASQLSGPIANLSFTASASNDIAGNFTMSVSATDSKGETTTATP